MSEYVLELRDITKRFPGVVALNKVQFKLKKGEIHALMGENGAGKSTLIKTITGVHKPDEGQIFVNGEEVFFQNTNDSAAKSIAAIYQHSTTYLHLSVTENIFIGHEIRNKMGLLDWKEMHRIARELLQSLGSNINPRTLMGNLSVAEQQVVEISKAVSANAQIVIMDEPTAALSKRECEELYRITEQLKKEGKSIIFISHRLEDMYRLADTVTVFRDATYIGTWDIKEVTNEILVQAMVGREIKELYPKTKVKLGETALEVKGLSRMGYFRDVTFSVRRGEILGLTGLVGAGRSEVCQAVCGITPYDAGEVYLNGKAVHFTHPAQAMKHKLGYLPEDRQIQALLLPWEIYRNATLASLEKYSSPKGIDKKRECEDSEKLAARLSIKAKSIMEKAGSLSGGNQQKVVLAKLLNMDLDVLILDEPTKGVDVGAKSQIYEIMTELAEKGYAIVLISSEMPEVLAMSDRIAIMHEGSLVKILDREEATQEKMLAYAMNSADEMLKGGE
ncbi:MAG: sugar ABC transporter ATP-binding protein [Eubacteriales bacterium]|nr:sugar ABC transporter ATP-binding protein [Eubacteriales bacterium]